ncbi:ABC transporter ATP-binding protein, partial [Escherichia coli]|uniref:ABC transporter ATP-binding protein n=1 Tax=Escherichia coli TaxID=562 RepID=UPI00192A5419
GEDHRQLLQTLDLPDAELDEADPRFEDAFIDLLGGGPNHRSALAEIMPTVDGKGGETVIEAVQLAKKFGDFAATDHVDFQVRRGEIFGLLGPNGAGKSTTLNVISRLVTPTAGSVRFAGEPIHRQPADAIVGRGIVQVPEGREIFREMSVRENLEMGAYLRQDRLAVKADLDMVCDTFPRLRERFEQKAATLSGGEQQMLATGRAMMARPR